MFEPDKDIIFEDLMGITHDTGDAFLDKKLNQNTAYILGTIGAIAGGALLGAMSKPKAPKVAGGGIDEFLKPYLTPGLDTLKSQFEKGPQVFPGEMVAGFTPEQVEAQTSLLALATAQPDYFKTALTGLDEITDMYKDAAAPITAEEIAAQRELLEPMAEAQRIAQQQAFEGAVRDIGLSAGSFGSGQFDSDRSDILRGGAAGQLALGMADIEGQLQKTALQQAEADRLKQVTGAGNIADVLATQLGISKSEFEDQLGRIDLMADVGKDKQILEQDKINAAMLKFKEQDPFAFTQKYLGTVFGTPTLPTQIYQPQSTMQSVLGGISALSGFANQGGGISSLAAGGSTYGTPYAPASMEEFQKDLKDLEVKKEVQEKFKKDSDRLEEEEKEAKKKKLSKKIKKGLAGLESALTPKSQFMGQQQGRSRQVGLQNEARQRFMRQVGMLNEGGVVNKEEKGILSKIMDGVRSGYQTIKNIEYDPETESLGKYDPFAGFDKTERLRIGLAMIGQMPQLGQGPLSAAAAGATPVLEQITAEKLTEAETARKARADELGAIVTPEILPSAAFRNIEGQIGVLYGAKVVRDATGQVIGIDQTGLDSAAQAKVAEDTKKAIKVMEKAYKTDPSTAYSVTLDYITDELGPLK